MKYGKIKAKKAKVYIQVLLWETESHFLFQQARGGASTNFSLSITHTFVELKNKLTQEFILFPDTTPRDFPFIMFCLLVPLSCFVAVIPQEARSQGRKPLEGPEPS